MARTEPLSEMVVRHAPAQSGVYHLKNRKGEIIHTGVAGADKLRARLNEQRKNRSVREAKQFQIRPLSSNAEARRVERALFKRTKRMRPGEGNR